MERRPLKRLKRFLRFHALRGLFAMVGALELTDALAVGRAIGWLGFHLAKKERLKALASLEVAFPELSGAERLDLAKRTFMHLGESAAELCCLEEIDRRMAEWVELPAAERQLMESTLAEGKGVVFVSGHVGNFELLARRFALGGYPCQTIAKEASDPRLSQLIADVRARGKLKTIWRGRDGAAKDMLRALKSGEILGLLIDQDTKVQGVFVKFFGKDAFTPRAAADLAVRTGAAVVAGFIRRKPDGSHVVSLERVPVPTGADREALTVALTQDLTARIEAAIRRSPAAWVWMHQRWKTRPHP